MTGQFFRSPFGIAAFLLPVMAILQYKQLSTLFVLLVIAVVIWERPASWRVWPPLVIGLAVFLVWCLLSALWSIDAAYSLARFAKLAPTVLAGVALCIAACSAPDARRDTIVVGLGAGLFAASVLALLGQFVIWLSDGSLAGSTIDAVLRHLKFRPFSSVAALLMFPLAAMAVTRTQGWLLSAILPITAGAILAVGSYAAITALIVGAAVFGLTSWLGPNFVRGLAVALPVVFIAVPGVTTALDIPSLASQTGTTLYHSAAHRLVVWRFVGDRVDEKPYLGWGLHATRRLPGRDADARHDPYYADILAVSPYHPKSRVPVTSVHPHNATLHIRVELGLPGMILYAALYCLVCLALLRRYSVGPGLAAAAAVITSAFVTGQLSFSVWQSWWLTTQFLAAALLLAMIRPWGTPQETTAESP